MSNYINRLLNKFLIIEDGYRVNLSYQNLEIVDFQELTFRKLLLNDLELIRKHYSNEITFNKYLILKNRINEDQVEVFCVEDSNNDILGYFCISYKNIRENGINQIVEVCEKSAYLFDDYVFSKYRGKGIQRYSIINRLKEAIKMNREYALVNVYSWNIKSISNYRKIGFNKYIRYYYFRIIRKIVINKNYID